MFGITYYYIRFSHLWIINYMKELKIPTDHYQMA